MDRIISAKELRASLPRIVERVRRGERFTVMYRSRPALRIVPVGDEARSLPPLEQDPLYRAPALFSTEDALTPDDYDDVVYGK